MKNPTRGTGGFLFAGFEPEFYYFEPLVESYPNETA